MIKKTIITLLVLIYIIIGTLSIFAQTTSNTIFNKNFYNKTLETRTYEFIINTAIDKIADNNLIKENFTKLQLKEELTTIYSEKIFQPTFNKLVKDLTNIRKNTSIPIVINLETIKNSLLTLAHNLSYKLFLNLPKCTEGQLPTFKENEIPTCIPKDVKYNYLFSNYNDNFKETIDEKIPLNIMIDFSSSQNDTSITIETIIKNFDTIKLTLFILSILLIILLATIIKTPFSLTLLITGITFILTSIVAIITSTIITLLPKNIINNITDTALKQHILPLIETILKNFNTELIKISSIYLALGLTLILIYLTLIHI